MGITILGFLKKVPLWMWLLFAVAAYVGWSQGRINDLQAEVAQAGLSRDTVTQVDSVTVARLAQTILVKDSLADALDMAETLNATLVAASRIRVDPRPSRVDTQFIPVEILKDSTRIGYVNEMVYAEDDSTEVGVLEATVTAPPCCAPLRIVHSFDASPIDFTVVLARYTDNTAVFSVRYWGGEADIEAPYARLPAQPKRFEPYVGGQYNFSTRGFEFKGGVVLRLPVFGLSGVLEGMQPLNDDSFVLTAGVVKGF